ncbi:MAG TPA: prepilin-type N-terminal cleavage/methylation domain-containing protein [Thermaerobacter sp.]
MLRSWWRGAGGLRRLPRWGAPLTGGGRRRGAGRSAGGGVERSPLRRQGGFTLIELGVVLAVIAILVGVSVPMYAMIVNEARTAEARQTWNMVRTELWTYFVRYGDFPGVRNGWWTGIDPAPKSNYWTYTAVTAQGGNSATLVAAHEAEKLCWTLDDRGRVTEKKNQACP